MRRYVRICAPWVAALLPTALWAATAADAIIGTWLTDDGDSRVGIAAAKASDGSPVFAGTVVWLREPTRDGKPLLDANNADPALRERPVLGLVIASGFKPVAAGWADGTIYAPRTGKSFPAALSLATDGRLQVKVNAGLVSKTLYWTR